MSKCTFESNDVHLRAKCSFCGKFGIFWKNVKKCQKKCQNDIAKVGEEEERRKKKKKKKEASQRFFSEPNKNDYVQDGLMLKVGQCFYNAGCIVSCDCYQS